jgi:UDP-N-acetyl-D-mannosaminuronate dehydrogenase
VGGVRDWLISTQGASVLLDADVAVIYGVETEVLKEADILLVLVDHAEFKGIDRELDTRGVWR